jgi:hypothetical protein
MKENLISEDKNPSNQFKDNLEQLLREGARKLLMQALENEVAEYLFSITSASLCLTVSALSIRPHLLLL